MELDVERACLASPVANSQDPVGMAQRMMALSVPSPLPATISGWSSFSASAIANSGVTGSGVQV
jgi:thiazole synthase ThiGH ThiG subunit